MWIAICDDEKKEAENLCALIDDYAAKNDYDIHCRCFLTGKSLLACEKQFDMYFLDYQMAEMNGLELEKKLREEKKFIYIIRNGFPEHLCYAGGNKVRYPQVFVQAC